MLRFPVAFARFWWDFIVGDSIILAIGGFAVLVVALGSAHLGAPRLGDVLVPLGVIGTVGASLIKRD